MISLFHCWFGLLLSLSLLWKKSFLVCGLFMLWALSSIGIPTTLFTLYLWMLLLVSKQISPSKK